MLLLRRVEIVNFACFQHVDLKIAHEEDRPLTVIRAENGSGKTTFLRALRWAFFGEKGLPGDEPGRFSVHPAWWSPEQGSIETKVSVTFETDGGTRHDSETGPRRTFRLTRSVETIARSVKRDDEPDFRRIQPAITLLQRQPDGGWIPYSDDPEVIERAVDLLLPWGLRDFFFLDADEATDFVGGRENKPLPKKIVIEKTTSAVNELLGLETFQQAMERVAGLQRDFQRQASRASGDRSIQEMQEELDGVRHRIEKLGDQLQEESDTLANLEGQRDQIYADLQEALKETGAYDQLDQRLLENRENRKRADTERKRVLDRLSTSLEVPELLSGLAAVKIRSVFDELDPLHQKGLIPLNHVSFVRDRIDQEECICGESLKPGRPHRANVERLLSDSVEQEDHANLLGALYDATGGFLRELKADTVDWSEDVDKLRGELGELDEWLAELDASYEELDKKISQIDREQVQALKGELEAAEAQIDRLSASIGDVRAQLQPLREQEVSLDKKVSQGQKREQSARDKQAAASLAGVIGEALKRAYGTIQQEQVRDLSARMNNLFASMAANVRDEDFGHAEDEKANVRMIAEVGVREAEQGQGRFEIFAKNQRGRILPPVEINGASRRVLALSFILALCEESNTEAPLVADSLLNMMSGKVRTNTFRTTAVTSRQPILLLTRADLAEDPELDIVDGTGGATFTLSGQWDVAGVGGGGDLVNRISDRLISIACSCGPRDYCEVCERLGDVERQEWKKIPSEIQGTGIA
jgi:DNA sulfur modification protein DndD